MRRTGIKNLTDEKIEEIRELKVAGYKIKDIAKATGVSRRTVCYHTRLIPCSRTFLADDKINKIVNLKCQGYSDPKICAITGVSEYLVRKHTHAYKTLIQTSLQQVEREKAKYEKEIDRFRRGDPLPDDSNDE